jgi:hypothetical protein
MTDVHTEVISAFCDGEIVDPDRLAAALADPRGREALIDFARLRAAVGSVEALPASLATLRTAGTGSRVRAWAVAAAAAAMVLLIVAAASLLPRSLDPRNADQSPPAPTRVLRFVPGVDWHAEGGR